MSGTTIAGTALRAAAGVTAAGAVGLGYAVGVENADDRVLAVADFVCPSVDEEGVAQVIEAYLDSVE